MHGNPGQVHTGFNPGNLNKQAAVREVPVYLGGKIGTEKVIINNMGKNGSPELSVQKNNPKSNSWEEEYRVEFTGWKTVSVFTGYWEAAEKFVLVAYQTDEKGQLDYKVLGRKRGKIAELLERTSIPHGAVRLEGGALIEAEGNRLFYWVPFGRGLAALIYEKPSIPDAVEIEYSINKKGIPESALKEYTVKPGTVVQFIRTDNNPVSERIMLKAPPIVRTLSQLYAFQITGKGMVEFTIEPEKDKTKNELTITVKAV